MFRLNHDFTRFRLFCRRPAADRRGVILPLVVILVVPLISLIASRHFDLQTHLQMGADASALAAAAERDVRSDAATRAQNAITGIPAYALAFDFRLLGGLLRINTNTFPTNKTSISGEDPSSSG